MEDDDSQVPMEDDDSQVLPPPPIGWALSSKVDGTQVGPLANVIFATPDKMCTDQDYRLHGRRSAMEVHQEMMHRRTKWLALCNNPDSVLLVVCSQNFP